MRAVAGILLLCASLVASAQAQSLPDPLSEFVADRLVTYQDEPESGYEREDYQWHLHNTGQDSRLFLNGVFESSEPGGTYDIKATEAWAIQPRADGVIVGVVDAGCQSDHEDMADVILKGHTFDERYGTDSDNFADWNTGHGTMIAGIIAAHRDNGLGISGIADGCKMLIVSQSYSVGDITKGINWCVDNGANIICLSWGGTGEESLDFSNACARAGQSNVVIVTGEFNNGANLDREYPTYPYSWKFPHVVSVTGLTREGVFWPVSAYGTNCIGAPARIIIGTSPGSTYGYASGNSFASPIVAGVLALMKAHRPEMSAAALVAALKRGSDAGRLDARGALLALDDPPPLPQPPPAAPIGFKIIWN